MTCCPPCGAGALARARRPRRALLAIAFLFTTSTFASTGPPLEGEWSNRPQFGGLDQQIVLRIRQGRVLLDVPDERAFGLPSRAEILNDRQIRFVVDTLRLGFDGTLRPEGTAIAGTLSMGGKTWTVAFHRLPAEYQLSERKWNGSWLAEEPGPFRPRYALELDRDSGSFASSPAGGEPARIANLKIEGRRIEFDAPEVSYHFDGIMTSERAELTGSLTHERFRFPVTFKRVERIEDLRRPQTPRSPLPYVERQVQFRSSGVTLSGTLTSPHGSRPSPAVVLLSTAGPQDRDGTVAGHKPYKVIADHLTKYGITVLRFDDRGYGRSTGSYDSADLSHFTADAKAALEFLRLQREADPKRTGILAHGESSLSAFALAEESKPDFLVLLGGIAVPPEENLLLQILATGRATDMPDHTVKFSLALQRDIVRILKGERSPRRWPGQIRFRFQTDASTANLSADYVEQQIRIYTSPAYRYLLDVEPAPQIAKLAMPLLALWGDRDMQAPAGQNMQALREGLQAAKNKKCEIEILPRLNHLFQTANLGLPSEYGTIEETCHSTVLERVTTWILKHAR